MSMAIAMAMVVRARPCGITTLDARARRNNDGTGSYGDRPLATTLRTLGTQNTIFEKLQTRDAFYLENAD